MNQCLKIKENDTDKLFDFIVSIHWHYFLGLLNPQVPEMVPDSPK